MVWRSLLIVMTFVLTDQMRFNVTVRELSAWAESTLGTANSSIINNTINVEFDLRYDIKGVEFRFAMHELRGKELKKILDEQVEPCLIQRLARLNQNAFGIMEIARKYTNFVFECKYKPGIYYVRKYRPGSEIIPLRFVYKQNIVAQFKITFYRNHRDKIAHILVKYEVRAK